MPRCRLLFRLLPPQVIAARKVTLEPHVEHDEQVAASHLLDLQLGHARLAIGPRNRQHRVGIPAHDRFKGHLHGQIEVRRDQWLHAVDGMQPLISPHFNLTVEMPLKAIMRGYSYAVLPISWTNRKSGMSKLKIKEMGSRYLFIVLYVWLERHLSRGDYLRREEAEEQAATRHA